jgi:hypothetical protein
VTSGLGNQRSIQLSYAGLEQIKRYREINRVASSFEFYRLEIAGVGEIKISK